MIQKIILMSLVVLSLQMQALAQQETLEDKKPKSLLKKEGWHKSMKLSGNVSMSSNDKVIGQQDGDTMTFGFSLGTNYNFKENRKEWRNSLSISAATSKTPTLPKYVKSADETKFETIYLYGLESFPKAGPYIKASAQTALFKGEDIRSANVDYKVEDPAQDIRLGARNFQLTDAFKPLTTKESIGVFYNLYEKENLKAETRLGVAAQQVQADGQFSFDKFDEDNNVAYLKELESYSQAGMEWGLDVDGSIDKKTTYSLALELFQPFDPKLKDTDDRKGFELLDSKVVAKITSKVTDWMDMSLEGKYQRQPQLQKEEQKSVMFLVNFSKTLL